MWFWRKQRPPPQTSPPVTPDHVKKEWKWYMVKGQMLFEDPEFEYLDPSIKEALKREAEERFVEEAARLMRSPPPEDL